MVNGTKRVPVRLDMLVWIATLAAVVCGCSAGPSGPPVGSCLVEAEAEDDQSSITAVLAAEGELVVAQEIDTLMALWANDGMVVDAKQTPDNPDDDQKWLGYDAIRHRYVRTVFPGAPASIQPTNLTIQVDGTYASVVATTRIDTETAPAGDRWELVKQDGCWLITSLTYNLEPISP